MPSKKRRKGAKKKNAAGKLILNAFKGAVIGLIITIAAVLALALIVKSTAMEEAAVCAANQIIKVAAVFVSAFAASKAAEEKQLLTGAATGLMYVLSGFLIFSVIEGEAGNLVLLLEDALMGIAIGAIVGVIFGKLLKKEKSSKKTRTGQNT